MEASMKTHIKSTSTEQYVMIRPELSEMVHKLLESKLVKQAEEMGFEVTITFPKDSTIPL